MIIYGIDPGLAHMGVARVELFRERERVLSVQVLQTKKNTRKQARVCDDNVIRCRALADELFQLVAAENARVAAFCCEAMSWPRNLGSAVKTAMSWGIISSVATFVKAPILQVSPQEVKKTVTGRNDSSKELVRSKLDERYGDIAWGKAKTRRDHESDALGAVVACLNHEVIQVARQIAFVDVNKQYVLVP